MQIYVQKKKKKPVQILPKDKPKFQFYQNRFLFILAVFFLGYSIFSLPFSLFIGGIATIWVEYTFYSFLKACPPAKSYTVEKEKVNSKKQIIKAFLYLMLGSLLVINAQMKKADSQYQLLSIGFCLFSIVQALLSLNKIKR